MLKSLGLFNLDTFGFKSAVHTLS